MERSASTPRIEILLKKMQAQLRFASIEQALIITRCYQENEGLPRILQRSLALKAALEEIEIAIEPEELIVVHLQAFGELGRDVEAIKSAAYVEPLFRKLLATWESKDTAAYNRSVSVLYSIFEALQDANERTSAAPPASIRAGVALLQERYRDPGLRIGDLAKACFVSEVYFRNVFRQHFGKSPKKMLDELRFRHACDLLTSEYYTQAEVARRSGFEDVKFFRTAFKKHMGITPGEYKKGKG